MVGTISFSLYGAGHKYTLGAIENAELATRFFPGWKCRFYCAGSVPAWVTGQLDSFPHVEIVRCEDWMFGRFRAAFEGGITIVRDADSRLGDRDSRVVAEWLTSGRHLLVVRDHPAHTKRGAPVLGGLWGFRGCLLGGDTSSLTPVPDYGADMDWLRDHVWRTYAGDCFAADFREAGWMAERVEDFIGQVYEYGDPVYHPDSCRRFAPDPAGTHRSILARAIELTAGPILELGVGRCSSPLIRRMATGRAHVAYDTDCHSIAEFGGRAVPGTRSGNPDWGIVKYDEFGGWSVALVDQQPATFRPGSISALSEKCEYIIVHDSECAGQGYERLFATFKYRYDDASTPRTTVVSNLSSFEP